MCERWPRDWLPGSPSEIMNDGASTSWIHLGRVDDLEEVDDKSSDGSDPVMTVVSDVVLVLLECIENSVTALFVTVERVEGDCARLRRLLLNLGMIDESSTSRRASTVSGGRILRVLPNQQSSSPTKTTSSQSPEASLLGSTSLNPTSIPSTSFSKTPRNIFMACTLAGRSRDSRTSGDMGRRDSRIHSRMAMSKDGMRSVGVTSVIGMCNSVRSALRDETSPLVSEVAGALIVDIFS